MSILTLNGKLSQHVCHITGAAYILIPFFLLHPAPHHRQLLLVTEFPHCAPSPIITQVPATIHPSSPLFLHWLLYKPCGCHFTFCRAIDLTSCFMKKTEATEVGDSLKPSSPVRKESLFPLLPTKLMPYLCCGALEPSVTCELASVTAASPVSPPFPSTPAVSPSLPAFHSTALPTAPIHTGPQPEDTSLVHSGHLSLHCGFQVKPGVALRFLTPCQFPLLLLPHVLTATCRSALIRRVL